VPTRLPVLAAKGIVLTAVTVVVTAIAFVTSYAATAPVLADHDLVPGLTDPTTWQITGGVTALLGAAAMFTLGIGPRLRSTRGSVTVAITTLLLHPGILQFIPVDWVQDAMEYLPLPAATAFVTVSDAFGGAGDLSAWQGAAIVAAWAVVPMVAAAIVLRRRDA